MNKILIIDDEKEILQMLSLQFQSEGYLVYLANDVTTAFKQLAVLPDLILLDINMPEMSGLEMCAAIREHVNCPIIFLTARISNQDKVNGLMVGGDDYITKPFSMDELFARVQAHLRREKRDRNKTGGWYTRDLIIDYGQRMIIVKNNKVTFSNKEFEIIKLLSMNAGQIFDREKIYEILWGFEADGDSAVIKEHVRKIRAKLAQYSDYEYLETVWGVGYRWKK